MPEFENVATCTSALGWMPVPVESRSEPGTWYNVWTSPWNDINEYICECPGYFYRGHCDHQVMAETKRCLWNSKDGPERQNKEQRRQKVCPRCHGQTQWVMEEVDDG